MMIGMIIFGIFAGFSAASVGLMAGASFGTAFLLYSGVGMLFSLGFATVLAFRMQQTAGQDFQADYFGEQQHIV